MENRHPIENIMHATMESIRDMIDVNTIVGEAITTADGCTIIPISRVSFGFVAGGSEYTPQPNRRGDFTPSEKNYPFAGIILNCSCPFRSDSDKKCPIYEVRPNICQSFLCSKSPDKIRSEKMLFYKKYPLVDMRQEFFRTK